MIPLTRAIPERISGYDDALYKSTFTLLTLLRQLKSHLFQSAFAVWSPRASASDSFYDFWRFVNMCMYACVCVLFTHTGVLWAASRLASSEKLFKNVN